MTETVVDQTLNTGLQSGIFWARSRTTARNYFTYNISGGNPGKYVVPSSIKSKKEQVVVLVIIVQILV